MESTRSCHAQTHRPQVHPDHRGRPDRHRPGLRVRLFGHPGVQGVEGGGFPRHPGQLQPGDDHDGPGVRRRHLHRAADGRHPGEDHRRGEALGAPADPGRPDGAQPLHGAPQAGDPREVRGRDDRRQARRDRRRARTASSSSRPWSRSASTSPSRGRSGAPEEARAAADEIGAFPLIIRPELHPRGPGRRHRLQPRGVRADRRQRPRHLPGARGAGRGVPPRLEGVRDGGHARPQGPVRRHLLDRELRPDGRPHRRLDHGRPGDDAHRQGVPGDARRLLRRHPRDRRRDRRLQHPVRRRSRRPAGWS